MTEMLRVREVLDSLTREQFNQLKKNLPPKCKRIPEELANIKVSHSYPLKKALDKL